MAISADVEAIPAHVWVEAWRRSEAAMKLADTTCDVVDGFARLRCGEIVLFKTESAKYLGLSPARLHDSLWAGYVARSKANDDSLLRSLRIAPLNVEASNKAVMTE